MKHRSDNTMDAEEFEFDLIELVVRREALALDPEQVRQRLRQMGIRLIDIDGIRDTIMGITAGIDSAQQIR